MRSPVLRGRGSFGSRGSRSACRRRVRFGIDGCAFLNPLVMLDGGFDAVLRIDEKLFARVGVDRLAVIDGRLFQKFLGGLFVFGLIGEGFVSDADVVQAIGVVARLCNNPAETRQPPLAMKWILRTSSGRRSYPPAPRARSRFPPPAIRKTPRSRRSPPTALSVLPCCSRPPAPSARASWPARRSPGNCGLTE